MYYVFLLPLGRELLPRPAGTNICSIHHPIYDLCFFLNDSLMMLLTFCMKKHAVSLNMYSKKILMPYWQGTFATPGMGMGGGGANEGQYLFHPSPNIKLLLVFD